jgi:hypothetical protein
MNLTFNEVLESVDSLPFEEKEILIDILKNRQNQHERNELLNDVRLGRKEYIDGKIRKGNSSDLMKEILS